MAAFNHNIESAKKAKILAHDFFKRHNFVHYPDAFSQYIKTSYSIPHIVNFSYKNLSLEINSMRGEAKNPYRMKANKLFDQTKALSVYQQTFIDYCDHSNVVSCNTLDDYMPREMRSLHMAHMINGLNQAFKGTVSGRYVRYVLVKLLHTNSKYERFALGSGTNFSIHTFDLWFDKFIEDVTENESGMNYFAHFMAAHEPFVNNAECKIHQPRTDPALSYSILPNMAPEQAEPNRLNFLEDYYQQVICVYHKLDQLMLALENKNMLDKTLVVILGDHGSRIITDVYPNLKKSTIHTLHSTLFAVRSPKSTAKTVHDLVSVQQLFSSVKEDGEIELSYPVEKSILYFTDYPRTEDYTILEFPE